MKRWRHVTVREWLASVVRLGVVVSATCAAACGPLRPCFADCLDPLPAKYRPDPAVPSTVVTVTPAGPWNETTMTVRKGERLLFTATGRVIWERSNSTTGPDGDDGVVGWSVGRGGLVGKVGSDGRPFEIGARVGLFPDNHPRPPHHPFPPPPLEMPRDGRLYLGFKGYTAGANTGAFSVMISKAVKIAP